MKGVDHYPVLIIGSGFGGSVTAARLTEAGASVCVLERGPWRRTDATEAAGIENLAPLPQHRQFFTHAVRGIAARWLPRRGLRLNRDGFFDVHYQHDYTAVCTSHVGGGSHVYTALHTRPEQPYWDGRHPELSDAGMARHYDWMMATMGSACAPADAPNKLAADPEKPEWMITEGVQEAKYGFRFDRGKYENNGMFGSRDNCKVTLDERLLMPAMQKGLVVKDRHEVLDIARSSKGFHVTVRDHHAKATRTLDADRVILAAGTLNTLRLLFASRARGSLQGMPALGRGIGGNGDTLAYWPVNHKHRDYSVGTPCLGRYRMPGMGKNAVMLQVGYNGTGELPLPRKLRERLKHDLLPVGCGRDESNGVASWRNGRLHFTYSRKANPVLQEIADAMEEMARLSGVKVYTTKGWTITVHPNGGARVAVDPAQGVVNACGEVHDIPGLFVADATGLPGSPGVEPSMTISAWASHVATSLAAAG